MCYLIGTPCALRIFDKKKPDTLETIPIIAAGIAAKHNPFFNLDDKRLSKGWKEFATMKRLSKILIAASLIAFSTIFISMTASAAIICITGTVEKAGESYVLLTANDVYVLGGDQIPAEIIGTEIIVTGTVVIKNDVKVMDLYIFDALDPK